MVINILVTVTDEDGVGIPGVFVEYASAAYDAMDMGQETDSNGKVTLSLEYDQSKIYGPLYLNGVRQGMYEFEDQDEVHFEI